MFINWRMHFKNKMQTDKGFYDSNEVLVWANELTKEQITRREFLTSFEESKRLDFPPANAFEFLKLSREDNCYFDYLSATENKYNNAVAYETMTRVGYYDLVSKKEDEVFPKWKRFYKEVLAEVRQGKKFTLPQSQQLEMKERVIATEAEAQAYIAQLKKGLHREA